MGRRGPKPLPVEVHRILGSSHQYDRQGEPDALPDPPEMPSWVAGTPDAVEMWERMRMRLQPFGLWSEQFTEAVAILCRTYADYRQARRDAEGQPHVLVRSDGRKYLNPLWSRVRGLMADWMKLDREFRVVRR